MYTCQELKTDELWDTHLFRFHQQPGENYQINAAIRAVTVHTASGMMFLSQQTIQQFIPFESQSN